MNLDRIIFYLEHWQINEAPIGASFNIYIWVQI